MIRVRVLVPFWDQMYGAPKPGTELEMADHHAIPLIRGRIVEAVAPDAGQVMDPRWEFRISPARYLQRFPTGRNAALARQVLDT